MDEETVNHNQRHPWENERVQKQKFPVVLSMRPDSCHIILNGSRAVHDADGRTPDISLSPFAHMGTHAKAGLCQILKGATLIRRLQICSCFYSLLAICTVLLEDFTVC